MMRLDIVDDGDFQIGAYLLSKHLGIDLHGLAGSAGGHRSVLSDSFPASMHKAYARTLTLDGARGPSTQRAALFLCFCGDLECGALTAAVTCDRQMVSWSSFGWQADLAGPYSASGYLKSTRSFEFERTAYLNALSQYV